MWDAGTRWKGNNTGEVELVRACERAWKRKMAETETERKKWTPQISQPCIRIDRSGVLDKGLPTRRGGLLVCIPDSGAYAFVYLCTPIPLNVYFLYNFTRTYLCSYFF